MAVVATEPLMVRFKDTTHAPEPDAGMQGFQTLEISTKTLEQDFRIV